MKQNPEKCCEEYKSDYQNLLTTLCERLGKAGVDSCCVVKIMGAADANEVPSQYGVFCSGNEKIMIYWWRHWHDFIYFISEKGKIKQAKWFNAYE